MKTPNKDVLIDRLESMLHIYCAQAVFQRKEAVEQRKKYPGSYFDQWHKGAYWAANEAASDLAVAMGLANKVSDAEKFQAIRIDYANKPKAQAFYREYYPQVNFDGLDSSRAESAETAEAREAVAA